MTEIITEQYRGIPVGARVALNEIAALELAPASGNMPLPVLTLDEEKFEANMALMLGFCSRRGLDIAPHAKTPMAPALAKRLVNGGAWGASVANIQQAAVMLAHGIPRIILANEVGGIRSGERLGALLARYPAAECLAFADSTACLDALAAAGRTMGRPMSVVLELGAGRAGARSFEALKALADHADQYRTHLSVKGVGAYEGSAQAADEAAKVEKIRALLDLCVQCVKYVKHRFALDEVIWTIGGSSYFDLIGDAAACAAVPGLVTILRSGAVFFFDHGAYEQNLLRLHQRVAGDVADPATAEHAFAPTMRIWAEVLSHPEPGLYICGMGKRDVSHDLHLPVPLALYRDGECILDTDVRTQFSVVELNDQHAFLRADGDGRTLLRPGDIVAFGISHPCTCFDKWQLVFGLRNGRVAQAYKTYFG